MRLRVGGAAAVNSGMDWIGWGGGKGRIGIDTATNVGSNLPSTEPHAQLLCKHGRCPQAQVDRQEEHRQGVPPPR